MELFLSFHMMTGHTVGMALLFAINALLGVGLLIGWRTRAMTILSGEKAHATQLHPMVRTHPVTGRRALFVNPVYTTGIEGMGEEEGRALLARFYEHLVEDDFVHRHRWRENMLLMWDNRCAIHNAEGGYEGCARLMHRTTVAGERPVLSP